MTTHNTTDLLALVRANKKLEHWQGLQAQGLTVVTSAEDGSAQDVLERIEYWLKQVEKYRTRIEKHIKEFEKIKDSFSFLQWVASIVETIKSIIQSLTK